MSVAHTSTNPSEYSALTLGSIAPLACSNVLCGFDPFSSVCPQVKRDAPASHWQLAPKEGFQPGADLTRISLRYAAPCIHALKSESCHPFASIAFDIELCPFADSFTSCIATTLAARPATSAALWLRGRLRLLD